MAIPHISGRGSSSGLAAAAESRSAAAAVNNNRRRRFGMLIKISGGSMRFSLSGRHGKYERRVFITPDLLSIAVEDKLRKIISVRVGIARGQTRIAVAQADIVEKQISTGGPVRRPAAHADAFGVSPA